MGALVPFEIDLAKLDFRSCLYLSVQIDEDIRSVRLPANSGNLDRRVRKTVSILIGAQPLNKVLQPQARIGRLRWHDPARRRRRIIMPMLLPAIFAPH